MMASKHKLSDCLHLSRNGGINRTEGARCKWDEGKVDATLTSRNMYSDLFGCINKCILYTVFRLYNTQKLLWGNYDISKIFFF